MGDRQRSAAAFPYISSAIPIALLLLLLLVLPTAATVTPSLPLNINCGGESLILDNGTTYTADLPYDPSKGYGYSGGEPFAPYRYLSYGGTQTPELYHTERTGLFFYDVDLPPGTYVVTLRLMPLLYHADQSGVFDITINSQPVAQNIDLITNTGRCYAGDIRVLVTTDSSPMRIHFTPLAGRAEVAAIEITLPDPDTPEIPPLELESVSDYGGIFLFWSQDVSPDTHYFEVERTGPDDDIFSTLPGPRNLASSFWDPTAAPSCDYRYRVTPIDLQGSQGPAEETSPLTALSLEASDLPAIYLEIEPDSLRWMMEDIYAERWVPVRVTLPDGRLIEASTRLRGGISRLFQKKSFKIKLPGNQTWQGRSILNLIWKAESTFIRESLAATIFQQSAIPISDISFTHLILNGITQGLYLTIEQINDEFLLARDLDATGSLYKVENGNMSLLESEASYHAAYEKKTGNEDDISEIIDFIEMINQTPDDLLPALIWDRLDVEQYLDWYSIIILTANRDVMRSNHYYYLPPESGRWQIFPWDNDLSFPKLMGRYLPLDMGAQGSQPPVSAGTNNLITRLLAVDEFRFLFGVKLAQLQADFFASELIFTAVDSLFTIVEADGLRDWRKLSWENNADFLDEFSALRTFIQNRTAYLDEQLESYLLPAAGLRFNEIAFDPAGDLTWIELINNSGETIRTENFSVSDRPIPGSGYSLGSCAIPSDRFHLLSLDRSSGGAGSAETIYPSFSGNTRCLALWHTGCTPDSLIDLVSWTQNVSNLTLVKQSRSASWTETNMPTPGWENEEIRSFDPGDPIRLIYTKPSAGAVSITCILPEASRAILSIHDAQGRRLNTLHDGWWDQSPQTIIWNGALANGAPAPSGIYFLRLSGLTRSSARLLLIR